MFAPYLEETVKTLKKFANYYKPEEPAYNTMLGMYERGLTMETADAFFSRLRERLVPLMRRVAAAEQIDDAFLHRHYPVDRQRKFSAHTVESAKRHIRLQQNSTETMCALQHIITKTIWPVRCIR